MTFMFFKAKISRSLQIFVLQGLEGATQHVSVGVLSVHLVSGNKLHSHSSRHAAISAYKQNFILYLSQLRRKWLPILSSQGLMFNRSTAQILEWKSNLQREENRSARRKIPRSQIEIDKSQPPCEPRTRSRVIEVGGASDDHYANLSPCA